MCCLLTHVNITAVLVIAAHFTDTATRSSATFIGQFSTVSLHFVISPPLFIKPTFYRSHLKRSVCTRSRTEILEGSRTTHKAEESPKSSLFYFHLCLSSFSLVPDTQTFLSTFVSYPVCCVICWRSADIHSSAAMFHLC